MAGSISGIAESYVGKQGYGNVGCATFVSHVLNDAGYMNGIEAYVPNLRKLGSSVPMSDMQNGDILILRSNGYEDGHVGIYVNGRIVHNSSSRGVIVSDPLNTFQITEVRRFGDGEGKDTSTKIEIPYNDEIKPTPELENIISDGSKGFNLRIITDGVYYKPVVLDEIKWITSRIGSPAKLEFQLVKDDILKIEMGSEVVAEYNGKSFFRGRVTNYKYDKKGIMSVISYDPLFFLLRSKDTYNIQNKTASDLIKMIAGDYQIAVGFIINTGYIFETRLFDNMTLLDIIETAISETVVLSKSDKDYCFYYDPNAGLTLKEYGGLLTNLYVDESNYSDYSFETSIEKDSYNKIKIFYNEPKAGEPKKKILNYKIAEDKENQKKWGGVLQHTLKADSEEQALDVINPILKLKNTETKIFSLSKVKGSIDVRAGNFIIYKEIESDKAHYVRVEEAEHIIKTDSHFMNLKVKYKGVYG